ncbi:transglutaminase-like domain-containing protein [Paenibacillus ehimensis]|uniref:transglutaminase-like domain-containing protein n=1 Tax=Paenibacillus ehimensis TaxID=79264 RepID=UPI000FD8E46C|nr:transglutaminase-like domain-containing protein [Paenibacillus ehimensis]
MFKKLLAMTFVTAMLFCSPKGTYAATENYQIDRTALDKGVITVRAAQPADVKTIVRISKGNDNYDYNLVNGAQYPLQRGNGTYSVLVAQLMSDNKYKVVSKESVELNLVNENAVFVQSIPLINWNSNTKAVVQATKLTNAAMTDMEKTAAIYSYITQSIRYDFAKAQSVQADYIPDLDTIYESSKGICYDYAAMFAAMARSQNIPTRLVMGYEASAPTTYHAWNQIYLNGQWVTIDTTYDATFVQNGQETPMIKNPADYTITQVY